MSQHEFEPGEQVIVTHASRVMGLFPQVKTVERLTPKRIVVDGKQYPKDTLECRVGTSWDATTYKLIPMTAPQAPRLLALRKTIVARSRLDAAMKHLSPLVATSLTLVKAAEIEQLMAEFIKVQQAYDQFPEESWTK